MTQYILHTVIVANRDNEGHEASRIHTTLELALAGLGIPDTTVAITPCRIVQRSPSGLLRAPATKYEVIDVANGMVDKVNTGYVGGYLLESAVKEICAGTDIVWRVVIGHAA